MRRKLERDFEGRQSVDDPFYWDERTSFNVFANRPELQEEEENKLAALNDLIKKREFAINQVDEDDFDTFLERLNAKRNQQLGLLGQSQASYVQEEIPTKPELKNTYLPTGNDLSAVRESDYEESKATVEDLRQRLD